MVTKKAIVKYKEGDCFELPGFDGVAPIVLVVRAKRGACIGYFYWSAIKGPISFSNEVFRRRSPHLIAKFSDMGIRKGEWKAIGSLADWDRDAWPLPEFASASTYAVRFSDDDPLKCISMRGAEVDELKTMPEDGFYGHVAVVLEMRRLISFCLDIKQTPELS